MTILGSSGTGPVVATDGRPLRALNPFDARAEGTSQPSAPASGTGPAADPGANPGASTDDDDGRRGASRLPGGGLRAHRRWGRTGLAAVIPVTLLIVWHLVTEVTGTFAPHELPSPGAVVDAGVELATWDNGATLWTHIQISVQRVLLGFALGSAVGLLVGALVGLSRLADRLFSGTLGAVRAIPSLGWVPLFILWMGINEDSKVILIALGAFFPVYTTVASALRHVDPQLVEAGRAYGLRGPSLLLRVQLPAATPAVVSGLRLALAQAWLFLVAAELIASSMGLGFLLTDSANNGRVDRILLSLVTLAVLGKTTDALIGVVERRLLRRW